MEVKITGFHIELDGSSFDDIIYDFCVIIPNEQNISLSRTYLDIIDFDMLLSSLFSDYNISPCPLVGGQSIISKMKAKQNNDPFGSIRRLSIASGHLPSVSNTYISYFSEDRNAYLINKNDVEANLDNTVSDLNIWFYNLFNNPKYICLLESILIYHFFNYEDNNFRVHSYDKYNLMTEYDFLLPAILNKSKVVLTKFNKLYEVQRGQLVLYRLHITGNTDISFGIYLNDKPLLEMNKISFPSNNSSAQGSSCSMYGIEVPVPDITDKCHIPLLFDTTEEEPKIDEVICCSVAFDNKYAKMLSPTTVSYIIRVVDMSEYDDCCRRCTERNVQIQKRMDVNEYLTGCFYKQANRMREKIAQDLILNPVSPVVAVEAEEPSNVSNGQREMQEKLMQQKLPLNVSVELNEILEPQTDALKEENKILKEKLLQLNKVCDRLERRYSTLVMKIKDRRGNTSQSNKNVDEKASDSNQEITEANLSILSENLQDAKSDNNDNNNGSNTDRIRIPVERSEKDELDSADRDVVLELESGDENVSLHSSSSSGDGSESTSANNRCVSDSYPSGVIESTAGIDTPVKDNSSTTSGFGFSFISKTLTGTFSSAAENVQASTPKLLRNLFSSSSSLPDPNTSSNSISGSSHHTSAGSTAGSTAGTGPSLPPPSPGAMPMLHRLSSRGLSLSSSSSSPSSIFQMTSSSTANNNNNNNTNGSNSNASSNGKSATTPVPLSVLPTSHNQTESQDMFGALSSSPLNYNSKLKSDSVEELDFETWYLQEFGQSVTQSSITEEGISTGLKQFAKRVSGMFGSTYSLNPRELLFGEESVHVAIVVSPSKQHKFSDDDSDGYVDGDRQSEASGKDVGEEEDDDDDDEEDDDEDSEEEGQGNREKTSANDINDVNTVVEGATMGIRHKKDGDGDGGGGGDDGDVGDTAIPDSSISAISSIANITLLSVAHGHKSEHVTESNNTVKLPHDDATLMPSTTLSLMDTLQEEQSRIDKSSEHKINDKTKVRNNSLTGSYNNTSRYRSGSIDRKTIYEVESRINQFIQHRFPQRLGTIFLKENEFITVCDESNVLNVLHVGENSVVAQKQVKTEDSLLPREDSDAVAVAVAEVALKPNLEEGPNN